MEGFGKFAVNIWMNQGHGIILALTCSLRGLTVFSVAQCSRDNGDSMELLYWIDVQRIWFREERFEPGANLN